MVAAAWDGASDADLITLIVDGRAGAGPKVEKIVDGLVAGLAHDVPQRLLDAADRAEQFH